METGPSWDREPSSAGVVTNLFQFVHVLPVLALKIIWRATQYSANQAGWSAPSAGGPPAGAHQDLGSPPWGGLRCKATFGATWLYSL